jgi:hypothetical protein
VQAAKLYWEMLQFDAERQREHEPNPLAELFGN